MQFSYSYTAVNKNQLAQSNCDSWACWL